MRVLPELQLIDNNHVKLTFSEIYNQAAGIVTANYTLGGTFGLTGNPSSVVIDPTEGSTKVILEIPSIETIGGLQTVEVVVSNVTSSTGQALEADGVTATYTESNAPKLKWYDSNNSSVVTKWNIGKLDAGVYSAVTDILVWNNRAGAAQRADMQNCKLTVVDRDGSSQSTLVQQQWIQAKLPEVTGDNFEAIGGETKQKSIKYSTANDFIISGEQNTGLISDKKNYARISLRCLPPQGAPANTHNFMLRFSYFYT